MGFDSSTCTDTIHTRYQVHILIALELTVQEVRNENQAVMRLSPTDEQANKESYSCLRDKS